LPGTRAEAEAIGAIARAGGAKAESWIDLAANEEKIDGADVANYRIVHIATHGLLDVDRPQFTGVVLSLVGNTKADGFLRTDEIFNLKMRPALVMLSACETGLGKEKRGEGVIGLTRAFMYAGAPTVGVSLWSVADKSTAELMTDFYKRLLSSGAHSSVTAMRDAQLAMIGGKKYSAPFYWAPFVLVGEWK
jgi:CHAT domain-containing protein